MSLFRPDVERLAAYVPGEQPQDDGWTKLNTNENPYPPSPRVIEAIKKAAEGPLNRYPSALGDKFREAASEVLKIDPDWILPANGSDENLTLILRAFVDNNDQIAFPYPSYVLYGTLAEIQGAQFSHIPLRANWSIDALKARPIVEAAKVVFLPNPNSPSGHVWSHSDLAAAMPDKGVLVLDEAYGDFCDEPHLGERLTGRDGDRIIITRTFSKSYSLAGLRFGFAIAHKDVIDGMRKVKDSYNCDRIALAAAIAAIQDQDWMQQNVALIRVTRLRLASELRHRGYDVLESQANFIWATHPTGRHREIYEALKSQKVLVRYMRFPGAERLLGPRADGLRITVGTDEQVDRLLEALDSQLVTSTTGSNLS